MLNLLRLERRCHRSLRDFHSIHVLRGCGTSPRRWPRTRRPRKRLPLLRVAATRPPGSRRQRGRGGLEQRARSRRWSRGARRVEGRARRPRGLPPDARSAAMSPLALPRIATSCALRQLAWLLEASCRRAHRRRHRHGLRRHSCLRAPTPTVRAASSGLLQLSRRRRCSASTCGGTLYRRRLPSAPARGEADFGIQECVAMPWLDCRMPCPRSVPMAVRRCMRSSAPRAAPQQTST